MYAKIFQQIYDSSIVESPEVRFTFMDLIVLSDSDGVVDMTHEAVARRTNRPLSVIRETISKLEAPDESSRTPDYQGRRIQRLDSHREWGWVILNFDKFRQIATDQQRREKTRERVIKHRSKNTNDSSLQSCNAPVTACNAPVTPPSASASASEKTTECVKELPKHLATERMLLKWCLWITTRKAMKKPKSWTTLFNEQLEWLSKFSESEAYEILGASIRNGWQGLFEPKRALSVGHRQPDLSSPAGSGPI